MINNIYIACVGFMRSSAGSVNLHYLICCGFQGCSVRDFLKTWIAGQGKKALQMESEQSVFCAYVCPTGSNSNFFLFEEQSCNKQEATPESTEPLEREDICSWMAVRVCVCMTGHAYIQNYLMSLKKITKKKHEV